MVVRRHPYETKNKMATMIRTSRRSLDALQDAHLRHDTEKIAQEAKTIESKSKDAGRDGEGICYHLLRVQAASNLQGICLTGPTDVVASQRCIKDNWCYINLLRVGSKLEEMIQSEFENEGTGSEGVIHDRHARCLVLLRAGSKLEQNLLSKLKDLEEGSKEDAGDRYARYLFLLSVEYAKIDRSNNMYVASVPLQAETTGSESKDAVKKDVKDALRRYLNLRVRRDLVGEIKERGGAKTMKQLREEDLANGRVEDDVAEDSSDEDEAADGFHMVGLPSDLYSVRKAPELGPYPMDEMVVVTFKQPRGYLQRRLSIYNYKAISLYPELYECVPFPPCSSLESLS